MVYNKVMVKDKATYPLNYLLFDEGLVNMSSGGYSYEYHLKDHLGNTRVTFQPDSKGGITTTQVAEYYPFGSSYLPIKPAGTNKYLYNGKEKQEDVLGGTALDWYDYGARFYDPQIERWHSPDPLAELSYDLTPFRYGYNNPVRFIDPFGLWETTQGGYTTDKKEDIDRFFTMLDIEKGALKNNPSIDQMDNFIKGEMSDGGAGTLSDGSKLAPTITVEGYRSGGGTNFYADKKSVDNFWHDVQRELTPYDLDPRTLNNNLVGSYAGEWNPKMYCRKDDFSYFPTNLADIPAYYHDKDYIKIGCSGRSSLFSDTRAIPADWKFVQREFVISLVAPDLKTKVQALLLGIGLGDCAAIKTINYYLTKPFQK